MQTHVDHRVADLAPSGSALTSYDEEHLVTYLRLLVNRRSNLALRIASPRMLLDNFSPMTETAPPNRFGGLYGGKDQHGRAA
jgi:hypothetical protein